MNYQVKQNGLWGDRAVSVRQTVNAISQIPVYNIAGETEIPEEFERLWAEASRQPHTEERAFRVYTGPEGARQFQQAVDRELTNMSQQQIVEYLDTL